MAEFPPEQPKSSWDLEDFKWVRPVVWAVVGIVTAVGTVFQLKDTASPEAGTIALAPNSELSKEVDALGVELRHRIEALEQFRERQHTFSQVRSAEIDRQIKELREELNRSLDLLGRAMDMIETNRNRLDKIVDNTEGRRKP